MASHRPLKSAPAGSEINRRNLLKTFGLSAAGVAAAPILASCTGASSSGSGSTNSTSVGTNYSGEDHKKAFADVVKAFEKKSDDKVKVHTFGHNDFQNNISNYLQGNADAVFTWFSGIRMKNYARQDLVLPIDDVWEKISDNFTDSTAKAATGDDGKKYLVPWVTYPWAVFYRKSLFKQKGYEVPKTWDDFKALCKKMKKDGVTPIAFGDKGLWPACGTFDQINLRLNGYDFHVKLMAHKESWNQKKVADVFDHWKSILPYHQGGALGRTWQQAADSIADKSSGMYVIGLDQIGAEITGEKAKDLDFFPFPIMNEKFGQDAAEAPIDGFMLSKKGKNDKAAKDLLEYLGTGKAQLTYLGSNKSDIATAKGADTSDYTDLQTKSAKYISEAKQLSQFLDRDALPAFASDVMEPALQDFIKSGSFDMKSVEAQAKQKYQS